MTEKEKKPVAKKRTTKKKAALKVEETKVVEEVMNAEEAPKEEKPAAAVKEETHAPERHHRKRGPIPKSSKYYGLGRRKTARAKIWMLKGKGEIIVNGKTPKDYFCGRIPLLSAMNQPFKITGTEGQFDAEILLSGGGVRAQADAIKMAVARALLQFNPELKKVLRVSDMLRRDPREKERKKYGLKRARRAFQYTKR